MINIKSWTVIQGIAYDTTDDLPKDSLEALLTALRWVEMGQEVQLVLKRVGPYRDA